MKFAPFIVGLLAGTVLGGAVVANTNIVPGATSSAADPEAVKIIVRDVILNEPQLIIESVQKFQIAEQKKQQESANEVLKDPAVREQVFNDPNAASTGPKDSKRVVAEFFDYNCGACKMMFKSLDTVMKKDPSMRIVFHEYPIFGPVSDTNAKIGLAVDRLYPEKYFEFHVRMMTHEGKVDEKTAMSIAKDLGMDTAKIKTESEKKELAAIIESNRELGNKLRIQGTPTLVIGDDIIPHGISPEELEMRLDAATTKKEPDVTPSTAKDAPVETPPAE